jgi:hypothetical protein
MSAVGRRLGAEESALLPQFRRLYIPHPRAAAVFDELRRSLELATHDHHLTLLLGPTGVGKTALWSKLEEHFRSDAAQDPAPDRIGSLYVPLEARSGAYRPAQLDRLLLVAANEPLIDRKLVLPGPPGRTISFRGTNEGRRAALLNVLTIRRPSVVSIDEAQHFTYLTGRGVQQALDDLKTVADSCSVPLLFLGTYELAMFSTLSGQLARRTREVHFARYSGEIDDWRGFLRTLNFLASHVEFDFDSLEQEAARFLYAGSIGCVGLLKRWLDRSLERALRHGRSAISRVDLESEAWPRGKLEKQLSDAQLGEAEMRRIRGDWETLYTGLGLRPLVDKKRGNATPGRRKPVRDVAGAAIGASNARSA